jgi:hypothetical protein
MSVWSRETEHLGKRRKNWEQKRAGGFFHLDIEGFLFGIPCGVCEEIGMEK